jgi:hypothetical protein
MPFTVIKGNFSPQFGRPDGDSVRFVPDNPDLIGGLRRTGAGPNINRSNGSVQLRYEAIDTMESAALQPFSGDATASNLELAGTNGGANAAPGYILSRQLGPNGRPICFAFAGETDLEDGDDTVFVDADMIDSSINVAQLRLGHAYPLFYDTLFHDLRDHCRAVSNAAKAAGLQVWAADATQSGATWTGDIDTLAPIFPKLWRRLDRYVSDETFFDADAPLANFKAWFEHQRDERILIMSEGRFTGFDDVVEVDGDTVRMTVAPDDIVVVSG